MTMTDAGMPTLSTCCRCCGRVESAPTDFDGILAAHHGFAARGWWHDERGFARCPDRDCRPVAPAQGAML